MEENEIVTTQAIDQVRAESSSICNYASTNLNFIILLCLKSKTNMYEIIRKIIKDKKSIIINETAIKI